MNADVEHILRLLKKESWRRKRLVIVVYFLTSLVFAALAWFWPQVFTSSSTVIVDEKNIIRPLMEGTAPTTRLIEPVKLAKQILNSRKTLNEILQNGDWLSEDSTPEDIDLLMDSIRAKIEIETMGKNIIKMSYKNKNAHRAYVTAKALSEIFVRECSLFKQRESREAYDFIDQQAAIYHKNLLDAETAIKEFREKNIDSTPGAKEAANERILTLTRQIEDLEIEITAEKSKLKAQKDQLTGGGAVENSASIARENTLRSRVTDLKKQLDNLRLVYKDTYPDIIQLKEQIKLIEDDIRDEVESRTQVHKQKKSDYADSPFAQEIRSQMLSTKTNISTLESKREQLYVLLNNERQKIQRINAVEAEITELTRDSEVNKSKYNELIAQRESARISMEMDLANQGVVARIQEAAYLPANPKGIRFIHLILAGLVLSFAVPLGIVYGLANLDQKVRDKRTIVETLKLPVLASIYPVQTTVQKRIDHIKFATIAIVIATSWAIYGYEIWLRVHG